MERHNAIEGNYPQGAILLLRQFGRRIYLRQLLQRGVVAQFVASAQMLAQTGDVARLCVGLNTLDERFYSFRGEVDSVFLVGTDEGKGHKNEELEIRNNS